MTNYTRPTVMKLSEQLHLCLAKAIDTALTNQLGANWFEMFKEFDKTNAHPILDANHNDVSDMDFQSCLKFFRFRENHAKIVFSYYGHDFYEETDDVSKAQKQLNNLLDNLIRNVRNYLYAHASAAMVQSGADSSLRYSVYGADDAVHDMLKLASFFSEVTDENNISYYKTMTDITHQAPLYIIDETIKKESLRTDIGSFVTACQELNISVSTDSKGNLTFASSNYRGDLAQIKLHLNQKKSKKSKKTLIIVIASVILLIAITLTTVLIIVNNQKNNSDDSSKEKQNNNGLVSIDNAEPLEYGEIIPDYSSKHYTARIQDSTTTKNTISLLPKEWYFENGKFFLEAYVFNGFSSDAQNVHIKNITISDGNKTTFATARFSSDTQNFSIPSQKYITHSFNFGTDAILTTDVDLSHLSIDISYSEMH